LLYIRQFVLMIVAFYTSRVILQVLGVSDFGLYNVVSGSVTLFAFINGSMSGCTQRYLSFALGKNDYQLSRRTFSVSLQLHAFFALSFWVIMECVGYYMLNHVLNIPTGKEETAFFVYNISLLSFCVNFLYVPFEAAIIAHEKMGFYSYLSIFDVLAKLGIVYILLLFPNCDSLRLYVVFLLFITISSFIIYSVYCCIKFEMCSMKIVSDRNLMKEMSSYTFWNSLGHVSWVLSTQGYNIIFNIFFGTTINAARGLAVQVSGAVSRFTQNYQLAFYPQIVKLYAADERKLMLDLIMNASVYSFYLVLLFGLPLFWGLDIILEIWLTEVPEYTSTFITIFLIQILISSLDTSLDRAIVATGRVKTLNVFNTFNQFLFLFLSYILLVLGLDILIVLPIMITPSIVLYLYTLYLTRKYLDLDTSVYAKRVIFKCIKTLFCATSLPLIIIIFFKKTTILTLSVVIVSAITTIISIISGLEKEVRNKIIIYLKYNIKKYGNINIRCRFFRGRCIL